MTFARKILEAESSLSRASLLAFYELSVFMYSLPSSNLFQGNSHSCISNSDQHTPSDIFQAWLLQLVLPLWSERLRELLVPCSVCQHRAHPPSKADFLAFLTRMNATDSETEISVSIGLDVTAEAPQKIKVESGIGFLDHVSWHKRYNK